MRPLARACASLLVLVILAACGTSNAGYSSPTPSITPAAAGASATSGAQGTARIADIDAAIRAADSQGLLTGVIDCINAAANKSPSFWNSTLASISQGRPDFYLLVQAAAKNCGVTVKIVVRAGPPKSYSFTK
jgi:hypothetical protein